ncbi:MAG: Minf_1886 family protein [Candidatus Omnitrophota bacterium]
MKGGFYEKIEKILEEDARYKAGAYEFVMAGLGYTLWKLKKEGHVSGRELSGGLKDFAIEQFGPMARTTLEYWGIHASIDFGEIVYNMIDAGLMGRTEEDRKEDFKDIYDFDKVFGNSG